MCTPSSLFAGRGVPAGACSPTWLRVSQNTVSRGRRRQYFSIPWLLVLFLLYVGAPATPATGCSPLSSCLWPQHLPAYTPTFRPVRWTVSPPRFNGDDSGRMSCLKPFVTVPWGEATFFFQVLKSGRPRFHAASPLLKVGSRVFRPGQHDSAISIRGPPLFFSPNCYLAPLRPSPAGLLRRPFSPAPGNLLSETTRGPAFCHGPGVASRSTFFCRISARSFCPWSGPFTDCYVCVVGLP